VVVGGVDGVVGGVDTIDAVLQDTRDALNANPMAKTPVAGKAIRFMSGASPKADGRPRCRALLRQL